MQKICQKIATQVGVGLNQVNTTVALLQDGATIPFLARYRKEQTGGLDEIQIEKIRDLLEQITELEKRKEAILASIEEQGKLSPALKTQILQVESKTELEDLYLPYKPKRKTKGSVAIEKGLEPLAKILMLQQPLKVKEEAQRYICSEKGVDSIEDALEGARNIIAEWVNENALVRQRLRRLFEKEAILKSKVAKGKEEEGATYKNYFDCSELMTKIPSHRILAMLRGETEGFLKLKVDVEEERAILMLQKIVLKQQNSSADQVDLAVRDAYKRLLFPSMETELRNIVKEKADEQAIVVFVDNLRQLLLASPLGAKRVLALDPGFRSGCKVVCLDALGNLLHNETIYPHPPRNERKQSLAKILQLVEIYKIEAIAIGNGTAGRETEQFIASIPFPNKLIAVMVNENGASVYSASVVAREEFPDYDVTVRGAVSIGRRLMDPLAELVKIDPKSIGVGQYQHDVNPKKLQKSLEDTVVYCVNKVGVELNSASKQLLSYVSGLGESLASNIVEYRKANGAFKSRAELKKVPRFGGKAFEQAAGFLRISESSNILDRSAVHPESYPVVESMAKKLNCTVEQLVQDKNSREKINCKDYVSDKVGLPTLIDILSELEKPGRDPRVRFEWVEFDKNIQKMEDLVIGMELVGIVTNITAFGAFVDIGVHQDGLVHISQMADKFISNPKEVVSLNQRVNVKVLEVDSKNKRIQLSMKGLNVSK